MKGEELGLGKDDTAIALGVLHLAFIEARAAETLEQAQIIADIFHNVPMMIARGRSLSCIKDEVQSKAQHYDRDTWAASLFHHQEKRQTL